jgi:predicted regulator of Ras-like GTPase activity (Roadblock/LC7/MglB family)
MSRGVLSYRCQKETLVNPDGTGYASEVLAELQRLRQFSADIEGSIVATTDGLVVAHDLGASAAYGVEPEGVAALAAVSLGLSQRIADTANHGDLLDTVIRGALGNVVTYAAGERALLTILVRSSGDLVALRGRAQQSADRIGDVLADSWQDDAASWFSPPEIFLPRRNS